VIIELSLPPGTRETNPLKNSLPVEKRKQEEKSLSQ